MPLTIQQYIAAQPAERQEILSKIHDTILKQDKTVTAAIEGMMGKEMIMYMSRGMMKYALSGVKKYMSLHILPMYGNTTLYAKFQALLPEAAFQKGCVNFEHAAQVPPAKIKQLISDCAGIDLVQMREDQLAEKKAKKKK